MGIEYCCKHSTREIYPAFTIVLLGMFWRGDSLLYPSKRIHQLPGLVSICLVYLVVFHIAGFLDHDQYFAETISLLGMFTEVFLC